MICHVITINMVTGMIQFDANDMIETSLDIHKPLGLKILTFFIFILMIKSVSMDIFV